MKTQDKPITTNVTITKTDLNQLKRIASIKTDSTEAVIKAVLRLVLNHKTYEL